MAKYIFTKEYTASIVVGGIVGILPRTFKVGEIYPGIEKSDGIEIRISNHSEPFVYGDLPFMQAQETVLIPKDKMILEVSKTNYLPYILIGIAIFVFGWLLVKK